MKSFVYLTIDGKKVHLCQMNPSAVYSVVFPVRCEKDKVVEVLMGIKGRKIFAGKWVGPGGVKDLADASVEDCAVRETREETTLRIKKEQLEEVGAIHMHEPHGIISLVHFYLALHPEGKAKETKDKGVLTPTWHKRHSLPDWDKMPGTYRLLLHHFLERRFVKGAIEFDPWENRVGETDLQVIY